MRILIPVAKPQVDAVESYYHQVLELGLAYECLLLNVKIPNRDRMLPLNFEVCYVSSERT